MANGYGNPSAGSFPFGVTVDELRVTDTGADAPEIIDPTDEFDLSVKVTLDGDPAWLNALTGIPGAAMTITYKYNEVGGSNGGTIGAPVSVPLAAGVTTYDRAVTKLTCNPTAGPATLAAGTYVVAADIEFTPLPLSGLANGLHLKVR